MCTVIGYCRISTKKQSIERQIRNIKREYPDAKIVTEAFTGTKISRPEWNKVLNLVKQGKVKTIVFDSVSRMSRNADEGIEQYFDLYDKGVELVFLKEHYIDTEIYKTNTQDKIALTGTDEDELFKGINNYFRRLAKKQIRIAFEQAEKEVADLHKRTSEGLKTAKLNGKQVGRQKGTTFETKKSERAKQIILKHSIDFGGTLTDKECMQMIGGIARNSYYKYKRELKA